MRILYIIDDLRVGGAQVHLARLTTSLRATAGFDLEILSLGRSSPALLGQLPPDVPVRSFQMESVRQARFLPSFLHLVRYLRRTGPEIVHTYLNTAGVFGLVAARLAGVRRVITSRRDMGTFRSSRIAALEAFLSRVGADRVFCVCQAVADATRYRERIPEAKLRVLRNGIDTRALVPRTRYRHDGPLRFCMVAAMNRPEKGHREFVEAAARTHHAHLGGVVFWLAGDGPLRPGLEALAERLGLGRVLAFLGERSDVPVILDEVDVLVVPSYTEAMSNAVLEGMAKGLPVIATAVDGNLETVVDGLTGRLVPPKDPTAIAEAMLAYAADPGLLERQGRAARSRVESAFDLETMTRAYEAEYRRLAARD
jgi:glycosyltransferase involved in cell wall biosynthesis